MASLCKYTGFRKQLSATLSRSVSTSAVLHKNRRIAARKPTIKQSDRLTYEQSQLPYQIGVTKSWNSWNTSNLQGEKGADTTAIEDVFIRKFMHGTWIDMFVSEVVIKRRHNMIFIAGLVNKRRVSPVTMYFLTGYTEELLSNLLQRPVKLELQTVKHAYDVTFKFV